MRLQLGLGLKLVEEAQLAVGGAGRSNLPFFGLSARFASRPALSPRRRKDKRPLFAVDVRRAALELPDDSQHLIEAQYGEHPAHIRWPPPDRQSECHGSKPLHKPCRFGTRAHSKQTARLLGACALALHHDRDDRAGIAPSSSEQITDLPRINFQERGLGNPSTYRAGMI